MILSKLGSLYRNQEFKTLRITISIILILVYILLPILAIKTNYYSFEVSIDNDIIFELKAKVIDKIGESSRGKFYLVQNIKGGPQDQFVVFLPKWVQNSIYFTFVAHAIRQSKEIVPLEILERNNDIPPVEITEIRKFLLWGAEAYDLFLFYINPINIPSSLSRLFEPRFVIYNDREIVNPKSDLFAIINLIFQIGFITHIIYSRRFKNIELSKKMLISSSLLLFNVLAYFLIFRL